MLPMTNLYYDLTLALVSCDKSHVPELHHTVLACVQQSEHATEWRGYSLLPQKFGCMSLKFHSSGIPQRLTAGLLGIFRAIQRWQWMCDTLTHNFKSSSMKNDVSFSPRLPFQRGILTPNSTRLGKAAPKWVRTNSVAHVMHNMKGCFELPFFFFEERSPSLGSPIASWLLFQLRGTYGQPDLWGRHANRYTPVLPWG